MALSLTPAVGVLGVHRFQPDALAFLTVFPIWSLWLPGLLSAAVAWRSASRGVGWSVAAVWAIVIWFSSDSPAALLRRAPNAGSAAISTSAIDTLRVVSFNTGSERLRAADELARWAPDIVLLQESYPRDDVARLAESLFGDAAGWLWNNDTAILARGAVVAVEPATGANPSFALAEVSLLGRPKLHVISLRLAPQPVRFDFWTPDCWKTYASIRRKHRQELTATVAEIDRLPITAPVLIGGDFNAPADDAIFRLLRPKYEEAFKSAGCGWGCTLPNEFPLLRIDQVWATSSLRPVAAWSVASEHSDHRLVIADFQTRSDLH